MTLLDNSIHIQAPPEAVWLAVATLDVLEQYDPGVKTSKVLAGPATGVGASRQCDLTAGGWFRERVTEYEPQTSLAFELFDCTLPVKRLKHRYTLERDV